MEKLERNLKIPYGRQSISEEDISSVVQILRSDYLTQGPIGDIFAKEISRKLDCNYAIPTNSATSALQIAYLALDLGKGDILWSSPNTFVATTNAALHCGAEVDFVDINPYTYNISIRKLKDKLVIAEKQNKLPKIISCVHFAGQSCDMEEIYSLSLIYKFKIVEDASHAFGAIYNGYRVGSCKFSDITIFSLHPVKIITSGEGGIATTNNKNIAQKMKNLCSHGIEKTNLKINNSHENEIWNYQQISLGFNFRLTDIQSALGLSQLQKLDYFVEKRNSIAEIYDSQLSNLSFQLPKVNKHNKSSFHLYAIRIPSQNKRKSQKYFYDSLLKANILVNLHYIPVYRQPYYENLGFKKGYCPEAELYFKEVLSLPIFPALKENDQQYIIDKLKKLDAN